MAHSLEVIDGGFFTTVQDIGRYGYQGYGVPVSGALDQFALRAGNILVGNPEGSAGLEITLIGPTIKFSFDTVVCVTGGNLGQLLNGEMFPLWEPVHVGKGSVISFSGQVEGVRAYLSVWPGLNVPVVLGSRSTYVGAGIGGLDGRAIVEGDSIPVSENISFPPSIGRRLSPNDLPSYRNQAKLRAIIGPQSDSFTEHGVSTFFSSSYEVTPYCNRMGYRLNGPIIQHKNGPDIISDGNPSGAIQVSGEGLPIILLADRGTTGGYTKIATVISVDLSLIAQAQAGDTLSFSSITVPEAHRILTDQEDFLMALQRS